MGFNNFYKKKRREQKAQKSAEALIAMQTKVNNVIKENTATSMIVGMHYSYKLLYEKFIKPYEETDDKDEKCHLLIDLAKEISDKHQSTMAEAKAYCEKAGVQYDE
jgi:hypothetical protein